MKRTTALDYLIKQAEKEFFARFPVGVRPVFFEQDLEKKIQNRIDEFYVEREQLLQEVKRIFGKGLNNTTFRGWQRAGFPRPHVRQFGRGQGAKSYYPRFYVHWIVEILEKGESGSLPLKDRISQGSRKIVSDLCKKAADDLNEYLLIEEANNSMEKVESCKEIDRLIHENVAKNKDEIVQIIDSLIQQENQAKSLLRNSKLPVDASTEQMLAAIQELKKNIGFNLHLLQEFVTPDTEFSRIGLTVGILGMDLGTRPANWVEILSMTTKSLETQDFQRLIATEN